MSVRKLIEKKALKIEKEGVSMKCMIM